MKRSKQAIRDQKSQRLAKSGEIGDKSKYAQKKELRESPPTYYAPHPITQLGFVSVVHGSLEFEEAPQVHNQQHADRLNDLQGICRNQATAGIVCCVLEKWHDYDHVLKLTAEPPVQIAG